MSRSRRTALAIVAIMVVAVIAACTQKPAQKAATAGATASVGATAATGPAWADSASASASAPGPITATPATPITSATPATPAGPATSTQSATPVPSAASTAPTLARPSGTRYTNARFGFSFDVPAGYQAQSPPVDGDGLSFASPARAATVTAYGAGNVTGYSPAQELAQLVTTHESARDTISYRFFDHDVIALSGTTPHGIVFYQREVVYSAVIYTLLWSYPAATKAQYSTLVTQTVDSFVPGPDHTG